MPLSHYGVLVGRAVDARREESENSPHYQVRISAAGVDYRIAVNVKSQESPSDLLFLVDENFHHVITDRLAPLGEGFTAAPRRPAGLALDFIRANLFDRLDMRSLPPSLPGPDNDLSDRLAHFIGRAQAENDARVFAFGERWGEESKPDKVFGFQPGNGIHDIHMNQGNDRSFAGDDGVWQDGGLILHFPSSQQWVGIFLAFQSQAWHTDDETGHRLPDVPTPGPAPTPQPSEPDFRAVIVGALVNPIGPAPEHETVTLLNATPAAIDLTGWQIADQQKNKQTLGGAIGAGETRQIVLAPPVQLGNKGGIITLLDNRGLKVHGVSYTKADADREGWTIVF